MELDSIERQENLIKAINESHPPLSCPSRHPATFICIDKACEVYIGFCLEQECQCSSIHRFCQSVRVASFDISLRKMQQREKNFRTSLAKLQQQFLNALLKEKKSVQETMMFSCLKEQELKILEVILLNEKNQPFKRKVVKNLFRKLKHAAVGPQEIEFALLQRYEEQLNQVKTTFNSLTQTILKEYAQTRITIEESPQMSPQIMVEIEKLKQQCSQLREEREKNQEKSKYLTQQLELLKVKYLKLEEECSEDRFLNQQMKTKILQAEQDYQALLASNQQLKEEQQIKQLMRKQQDIEKQKYLQGLRKENQTLTARLSKVELQQKYKEEEIISCFSSAILSSTQDLQFLKAALKNPKSLNLLFRASENEFSAQRFHQSCDGIENTFTLVLTEFGKIIGGFTTRKWEQSPNHFISDFSKTNFLISFNLRQIMTVVDFENALWYGDNWAACFGGDLSICDRCHEKRESYAMFPLRYQGMYGERVWKTGAESRSAFCGSVEGYFRVLEYQVFKVVW